MNNNKESASATASASASASVSDDEEPMFDMNVRPSVLRASLMARAQRSSKKKRSESMPFDQGSRLSMQSNMSSIFSSAFDSRPSARSSTSSIGNWAPRARSSSVSSQGSTGSVNLDAIIASESDLNEEKPLELVEGDEVDWTSKEERPAVDVQPSLPTPLMANPYPTPRTHFEDQGEEFWTGSISENEIGDDEDDEEFGDALREISQLSLKTNSVQVRGLGYPSGLPSSSRISAPSSRLPPKKNPFDLDADYMDSPRFDDMRSGSRASTYSNSGTASNRSSISKMPTPSGLVQPKSGLKAPGASRLAQPGARPLVQPKSTVSRGTTPVGQAPKTGQAPRGLQAPRTGLQAPKTAPAPRTGTTTTRTLTKPASSRTGSSSTLAKPQVKPTGSRLTPSPASRVNTTRSQLAPPATIKRPNIPTSTSNRTSLLQAPASLASRSTGTVGATVARMNAQSQSHSNPGLTSPKRSLTMSGLASPTRIRTGGSAMVSPTSSQSSTSSLPSLGYGARDSSQRLLNATGATGANSSSTKSKLMGPRITTGRTSMYGSSAQLRTEEDYEDAEYDDHPGYAVLTPPHSPLAKSGSRLSMVPPTRLAIPTSTSRIGRPSSPMGLGLRGPQVHGLVSPKAGHHRY
ncbi:hypothetical protein BG000_007816 [Podila horticola]|nr:hypothetical protein BG000_007816 [Podila horticola]